MKNQKPKLVIVYIFFALIALILKRILSIPMFFIGIFVAVYKGEFYQYMKEIAEVYDVVGNVVGKYIFNLTRKDKKNGYEFGDRRDTISYALARNKYLKDKNNLNWFGKSIEWLTNLFEKDHLKKAITNNNNYASTRK